MKSCPFEKLAIWIQRRALRKTKDDTNQKMLVILLFYVVKNSHLVLVHFPGRKNLGAE
jgi:hypothetical protein